MSIRKNRLFAFSFVALLATLFLAGAWGRNFAIAATDSTGGTGASVNLDPNYVYAFPITLLASGPVTTIGVNWQGTQSGNVRVALYSAGSSKPASLLTQSAQVAMNTVAGWQDIAVTSYSATSGSYWVALAISTFKGVYYVNAARSYYAKSFGAFDSTWSASSTQGSQYQVNMRVTYTTGPDFTFTASPPTSQTVGAGSTASYQLNLDATGGYTGTVTVSLTSTCPSGATCTFTPSNTASSFPATFTFSVQTSLSGYTGTTSLMILASDGTPSRDKSVTLSLTVQAPNSFAFNVKGTATQIVVTLMYSWTGSGAPPQGSVTIAGPGGTPTMSESGAVVYDRTSIAVSGTGNTYNLIHRVTFILTPPGSAQVWTAYVSLAGVSSYTLTIEVS